MRKSQHFVEDPDSLEAQRPHLVREGKLEDAARRAIEQQRARGIAITFLRGDLILTQYPDGREEVIATLARRPEWTPRHATTAEPK
jgi:hypothetical protein